MGFLANIIQDSRQAIPTDVRVPEVSRAPILTPLPEQGARELIPSSDGSQTFEGSELRSQPAMPLKTNSGLKTKRGQPLSTTSPKHPQAVQQESNPSSGVIPTSIMPPKSVVSAKGQSIGVAPVKETRTFSPTNNTTQPQRKINANPGSATSLVSVHRDRTMLPVTHEQKTVKSSNRNDGNRAATQTTRSQKSNDDFIDALRPTEHRPEQDVDLVGDVQEMSVVEASDVRHASMAVPVSAPAMPDRYSQGKPDATHPERAAISNSARVQIGQINIVVEGPSDSKRQPVRPSSTNDLASRTFLRSL